MKYFSLIIFIWGFTFTIYGLLYPKEYCLDFNLKDTYYIFTYLSIGTLLIIFSLLLYAIHLTYCKFKTGSFRN